VTGTRDPIGQRLAASVPIVVDEPGLYWAAVAIILAPDPDSILLIRRAHREGDPWSGHMALPGGRVEPADRDLTATAMREAAEEVGIALREDWLLGTLDDVAPRTPVLPPVAVRPFVFRVPERPALRLNAEVAEAGWLELARLADPAVRQEIPIEVAGGSRRYPAFVVPGGVVWGMTERILSLFLERVGGAASLLGVDHAAAALPPRPPDQEQERE
jgi:8-oxo-dGTP pyrophosphatase MutT (NUDIX family)